MEALQLHSNTQSHWSSGSTTCFLPRGEVIRVPGMQPHLQWNQVLLLAMSPYTIAFYIFFFLGSKAFGVEFSHFTYSFIDHGYKELFTLKVYLGPGLYLAWFCTKGLLGYRNCAHSFLLSKVSSDCLGGGGGRLKLLETKIGGPLN